jgi:hypothetical protein
MTNLRAAIAGVIIALLPRRWRRWVLSTLATIVIIGVSFFVDALNTPSDPTIEQYTGHSERTSFLLALGAGWVLGTLLFTIAASIVASRPHYVAFPETTDYVETTATDTPVDPAAAEDPDAEDPDAEYKILRAAGEQLEALRARS